MREDDKEDGSFDYVNYIENKARALIIQATQRAVRRIELERLRWNKIFIFIFTLSKGSQVRIRDENWDDMTDPEVDSHCSDTNTDDMVFTL